MKNTIARYIQALAAAIAVAGFSASTKAQLISNGSFESQAVGTTVAIGSSAGGAVNTATFTGWRVFSVGSPSVANFTATIITNHSDGNLALRLSLTNTGGGTGLDHALDNFNNLIPVTVGAHYGISFDAAFISGATNLDFSVTEITAANGYAGPGLTANLVVSNLNYQTYSFVWTPLNGATAKVALGFRQQNSGATTYSVMSFDNVRFTQAVVTLDPIFTDNMVLQRDAPVRIYGLGSVAGDPVTVTFGGQTKTATVSNGVWEVWLDPMPANGLAQTLTITGATSITRSNILVGDVWLLGGQSNMMQGFNLFPALVPIIQAANQPFIRVSYVDWPTNSPQQTGVPQAMLETPTLRHAKWYACIYSGAVADAQALLNEYSPGGYFFATNLFGHTQVPVGLIMGCLGATKAQYWTPMSTMTNYPELQSYLNQNDPNTSYLYNSVINPIRKFSLRGVLWYQGETDNDRPAEYSLLFPRLIQSWRQAWGKDMPFIFASLSSYGWPTDSWAYLREAQTKGLSQTNTGMITTYDIGDYADIHPVDKMDVGYRFYMKARTVSYGENIVSSGPVFSQVAIAGGQATVTFTNVGSGLETRTVSMPADASKTTFYTASSSTLSGFTMCGSDRIFYPATAAITGSNTVVVQSASVPNPFAVRYAWASFALANLFNHEGFSAEPLRTDTFPVPRFATPYYSGLTNGSFEAEPLGTTVSIGNSSGGAVDTTTFTGWRVFSVGSPSVANFTATIITNHSDANLAMRLSLTNTGGGTGLDHGLDNDTARQPVTFGSHYDISFDAAFISGASNLTFSVMEFNATNGYTGNVTINNYVVSDTGYRKFKIARWTPLGSSTTKVVLGFRQQNSGATTYSVMSFDNVQFTESANTSPANGSFEAEPLGTTVSIGSSFGGVIDTTTFTGWRVFSVGSPSVANFTATIITNHSDGNLAMRLSLTNTGGAGGLDHGLDNANAMTPVTMGAYYDISFDAAYISGASNLTFSVSEFTAAGAYTGIQTVTNFIVSDLNYRKFSIIRWTPLDNTAAKVVVAFRQMNSGATTYSVMSFDNVQFADAASQVTAINVAGTTATMSISGNPGRIYVLQSSTNLLNWVNIATNTAPAGGLFSVTNNASSQTSMFYRFWQQ